MQQFIATLGMNNTAGFVGESLRKDFSCHKMHIKGLEWLVPVFQTGHLAGYERLMVDEKPQPDAVKAVRITEFNGQDSWILVADAFTVDDLTDICNGCCGATPEIADPTIPTPINEECPCAVSGNYTFIAPIPNNVVDDSQSPPTTLSYKVTGSANGAYFLPSLASNAYASAAALLSAVQSNWSNYGTWSLVTIQGGLQQLKLVSDAQDTIPATCAMINVELIAATYCLSYPGSPASIDNVLIGGQRVNFGAVLMDEDNPQAAYYALKSVLVGDVSIVYSGSPALPSIEYTGFQAPSDVRSGTNVVESFSAGAC